MARPQRCRRICGLPHVTSFCPEKVRGEAPIQLTLDEYEVIRLVDLEEKSHQVCASQMDISRSTVQEIYESARRKLAACLVYGRPLEITGGRYRLCQGREGCGQCCQWQNGKEAVANLQLPQRKGDMAMKIAVTYDNGAVFQHFGHTAQFKVYEVTDGKVTDSQVVDTNGSGHGALAGVLLRLGVDTLICGGIGGGAQAALAGAGIRLYGGVSGSADQAVEALLSGTLGYDPNVHCDHHDHEDGHGCGGHSCHE